MVTHQRTKLGKRCLKLKFDSCSCNYWAEWSSRYQWFKNKSDRLVLTFKAGRVVNSRVVWLTCAHASLALRVSDTTVAFSSTTSAQIGCSVICLHYLKQNGMAYSWNNETSMVIFNGLNEDFLDDPKSSRYTVSLNGLFPYILYS